MPLFDFSIDVLREYLPERTNENDFDLFWNDTLAELRRHPLNPRLTAIDCGLVAFDTFDVTFAGWNGEPIKGWFVTPKGATGPLPCVVEYRGYGGGRGLLYDHLVYGSAGYATLVVDSRGQQSAETGDAHIFATGPHAAGFVTDGAQSPEVHYYRRLIGDCVRAIDTARTFRGVDPDRIVVSGISQGAGLALATSGLVTDLAGVIADLPFLCHFRRASEICAKGPYTEIVTFLDAQPHLIEQLFRTLSYFDGMNHAARTTAPALFSVGMMDDVCPPSTVFAAYNHYAGDKRIVVWPYSGHAVIPQQKSNHLDFLREVFN